MTVALPFRPPETLRHRPVLVDLGVLDQMALRTAEGHLLTITWGEPDADGAYTPTLHTVDDGKVLVSRVALYELERRAGGTE